MKLYIECILILSKFIYNKLNKNYTVKNFLIKKSLKI